MFPAGWGTFPSVPFLLPRPHPPPPIKDRFLSHRAPDTCSTPGQWKWEMSPTSLALHFQKSDSPKGPGSSGFAKREGVWGKNRARNHNRRKPAAAFTRRKEARPALHPGDAPKPATREEQVGRGQGKLRSRRGTPTPDPPNPRSPSASAPATPDPGSPRWEPGQRRSLGCTVRPLPSFPKMPINLAISCPMACPGPGRGRTRWPSGAEVEPGRFEPRLLGRAERALPMRSRKPHESSAGPGNPLGRWPLTDAVDVTVTTNYLSKTLDIQGKWGSDSTSSQSPWENSRVFWADCSPTANQEDSVQ